MYISRFVASFANLCLLPPLFAYVYPRIDTVEGYASSSQIISSVPSLPKILPRKGTLALNIFDLFSNELLNPHEEEITTFGSYGHQYSGIAESPLVRLIDTTDSPVIFIHGTSNVAASSTSSSPRFIAAGTLHPSYEPSTDPTLRSLINGARSKGQIVDISYLIPAVYEQQQQQGVAGIPNYTDELATYLEHECAGVQLRHGSFVENGRPDALWAFEARQGVFDRVLKEEVREPSSEREFTPGPSLSEAFTDSSADISPGV